MNVRSALVLAALASAAPFPIKAAEPTEHWIALARSYLGSETALNAVTSIHYFGTVETAAETAPTADKSSAAGSQTVQMPAEIVVQKPFQQNIVLTKPTTIEKKALDGYDGWAKSTSVQNPKQWRFRLLEAQEIKQLRANTWENLNFFSGLARKGGRVELGDDATVEGVDCVKLSFIHADNIVFIRYFDKSTGRLVKTTTENGGEIREEGEFLVEGIRFPKKIINKAPNGSVTTFAIDRVVLNEQFPASDFAVPTLLVD